MKKFLLFIVVLLTTHPASAHMPYLVKENTINDPQGKPIILEKLFGDGVISSDPVSFQVRNRNGAVVARTLTDQHVAVFCPHINFCWAFPHGTFLPYSFGVKLAPEKINWDAPAPKLDMNSSETSAYKEYLGNKNIKKVASQSFEYPELGDEYSDEGFSAQLWTFIFSPLVIIAHHILKLTAAMLLTVAFPLIIWIFFKRFKPQTKHHRLLLRGIGILSIITYLPIYGLSLLLFSLTLGTPLIYMLLAMAVGLYSFDLVEIWTKRKSPPKLSQRA